MKKATLFAASAALLGTIWVSGTAVFAEADTFPVTGEGSGEHCVPGSGEYRDPLCPWSR